MVNEAGFHDLNVFVFHLWRVVSIELGWIFLNIVLEILIDNQLSPTFQNQSPYWLFEVKCKWTILCFHHLSRCCRLERKFDFFCKWVCLFPMKVKISCIMSWVGWSCSPLNFVAGVFIGTEDCFSTWPQGLGEKRNHKNLAQSRFPSSPVCCLFCTPFILFRQFTWTILFFILWINH